MNKAVSMLSIFRLPLMFDLVLDTSEASDEAVDCLKGGLYRDYVGKCLNNQELDEI